MRARRAGELRPRKLPSQRRSRETVAVLLEAAARVLSSQGYAGATTNRIAAKAGVSIGSLYEYFPNKDSLLVALMEAHIAEGQRILSAAADLALRPGTRLRDAVGRFVRAMIELHAHDRAMHRILFEEAPRPASIRRQIEAVEEAVIERVGAFLADHPEVVVADPHLAARVVVQTIEGLTHRWVVHGDAATDAAQADELVALCVGYLTTPR